MAGFTSFERAVERVTLPRLEVGKLGAEHDLENRLGTLGSLGEAALLGEAGEEHGIGVVADRGDDVSSLATHEPLTNSADQVVLLDLGEFHVKQSSLAGRPAVGVVR